ncbi:MAG TPA: tRNA (adenosine(37)-N6)-threonylcarbamoyltransferase complex ATPase subunit type 1 TsaE [Gammaproteobacteria bacterium]
MGQSHLTWHAHSEQELVDLAGKTAQRWRAAGCVPLAVGLQGELGAGKTAWVRAMLRGLGYGGRVPSPTYTLLEQYPLDGLTVVHLDLYRLASPEELEHLGLRDWLADPAVWLLVEWPERAPGLLAHCDVVLELRFAGPQGRTLSLRAASARGERAVQHFREVVQE